MSVVLAGWGTAVPPRFVSQEDAAQLAADLAERVPRSALIPRIYARSEVRRRHSVLLDTSSGSGPATQSFYGPAEDDDDLGPTTAARMRRYEAEAPALAEVACRAALADAGTEARDVTDLVAVSCSGFSAPGIDLALFDRLPLRLDASRTHVGFMGCHGALNGLRVAGSRAAADPRACVLLCAVELCTLHHLHSTDIERVVANSLFADGAAAVVVRTARPEDAARRRLRIVDQTSYVAPGTADLMSWRIGDHGFEMTLSPRVPDAIRTLLPDRLAGWLHAHGLAVSDVAGWAVHPGGPKILDACGEAAGLADERLAASREVLADFGNMSSPTVFFVLERLRAAGIDGPCVLLGFGPGLTVEMALLRPVD